MERIVAVPSDSREVIALCKVKGDPALKFSGAVVVYQFLAPQGYSLTRGVGAGVGRGGVSWSADGISRESGRYNNNSLLNFLHRLRCEPLLLLLPLLLLERQASCSSGSSNSSITGSLRKAALLLLLRNLLLTVSEADTLRNIP